MSCVRCMGQRPVGSLISPLSLFVMVFKADSFSLSSWATREFDSTKSQIVPEMGWGWQERGVRMCVMESMHLYLIEECAALVSFL